VKYRKEGEWIPWPIDLDDENDTASVDSLMGGSSHVANRSVGANKGAHAAAGFMTEYAIASNLTQIALPELKEGEGNVHTGATPPWMVDTAGKSIPTVPTVLSDAERLRLQSKNKKKINPRKLQPQGGIRYDQNWLPLFGRVFQSGPRSETRREFIEEVKSQKEFQKAVSQLPQLHTSPQLNGKNQSEENSEEVGGGQTEWEKEKEKILEKINKRKRT